MRQWQKTPNKACKYASSDNYAGSWNYAGSDNYVGSEIYLGSYAYVGSEIWVLDSWVPASFKKKFLLYLKIFS